MTFALSVYPNEVKVGIDCLEVVDTVGNTITIENTELSCKIGNAGYCLFSTIDLANSQEYIIKNNIGNTVKIKVDNTNGKCITLPYHYLPFTLRVKIDVPENELWEFNFNDKEAQYSSSCNIHTIEEDGSSGDEETFWEVKKGKIIHKEEQCLADALYGYGCGEDNCKVVKNKEEIGCTDDTCDPDEVCGPFFYKFSDNMNSECDDDNCKLATANDNYHLTGDIICGDDAYWYLCDTISQDFIVKAGDIDYKCDNNNWNEFTPISEDISKAECKPEIPDENKCCGDTSDDYGYVTNDGKYICTEQNKWQEHPNYYNIIPFTQNDFDVISYCGNVWSACAAGEDTSVKSIAGFTPKDVIAGDPKEIYFSYEGDNLESFVGCSSGVVASQPTDRGKGEISENKGAIDIIKMSDVGKEDYNDDGVIDKRDDEYYKGDIDKDIIVNGEDNCPAIPNPDQMNMDNDDLGDACDDTPNDNNFVCNPTSPTEKSFICYKHDSDYGAFTQCGGCQITKDNINSADKIQRVGEPLYLLEDFTPYDQLLNNKLEIIDTNYVIKVGFQRQNEGADVNYNYVTPKLRITDWRGFENLEFYVYFATSDKLKIGFVYLDGTEIYTTPSTLNVKDYSIDGTELGRWHHIVIQDIYNKLVNKFVVGYIRFYENSDSYPNAIYTTKFESSAITEFKNIFYLDRLFLTKEDITKNKYCSDDSSWFGKDAMFDSAKSICNEQPGYIWTGSKCCGDSPDESYSDTSSTNKEGNACWKGRAVNNDDVINELVEVKKII